MLRLLNHTGCKNATLTSSMHRSSNAKLMWLDLSFKQKEGGRASKATQVVSQLIQNHAPIKQVLGCNDFSAFSACHASSCRRGWIFPTTGLFMSPLTCEFIMVTPCNSHQVAFFVGPGTRKYVVSFARPAQAQADQAGSSIMHDEVNEEFRDGFLPKDLQYPVERSGHSHRPIAKQMPTF